MRMSIKGTIVGFILALAMVAGALLPVDVLLAQLPPGYVANRNLGDTGPANPPPLTPEQRQAAGPIDPELAKAAIEEITVPDEFEATVFATPPIFNSPTAIAAAPDGTVFLAGDGNG